jgi:lipoate-protein ligase A
MPERILSISILAEPLVAIVHNQNPWKETKPLLLKEDGVVLMRRTSGGGAGYGDKDQLMLTFVQSDHDLEPAFNVMKIALAKFGIKAERSGRNDLIVEGKKVSGSTFMTSKTKFLHSASLLVNSSLHLFGKYLTPNRLKLESKGTKSVEGRVSTLTAFNPNITVASASDAVLEAYIDVHKGKSYEIHEVDIDEMMQHADFQRNYAKSTDPAWIYGETREFSHQLTKKFPWALMEVHIESKGKSIISDVIIYSDAMHDELIPILARNLKGVSYSAEGVAAAMAKSKEDFADYPDTFANIDEFGAWLTENL